MHTTNLDILLLKQNQMQKEIAVNEAVITLDALSNNAGRDFQIDMPPDDVKDGDLFVISITPTYEEWRKYAGYIAYYFAGWRYIKPKAGLQLWTLSDSCLRLFDGERWHILFQINGNQKEG